MLDDEGKTRRDGRSLRAIQKKTRKGAEMSITSWIEYEYQMLSRLYAAGVDVPKPVAQSGNAILMGYIGEAGNPAPTLNNVSLNREEATPLFDRLMRNVRLMLEHDVIHADLSAITCSGRFGAIIISPGSRSRNVLALIAAAGCPTPCDYRRGVRTNPQALAGELWTGYERRR
jgi:hypothetical protein